MATARLTDWSINMYFSEGTGAHQVWVRAGAEGAEGGEGGEGGEQEPPSTHLS